MKTIYSISLYLCVFISLSAAENERVILRAVRGRDATLPCGQGKVFLDGPDSYVLWMKDNNEFLYRYPNEDSIRSSSIQSLDQVYESQSKGNYFGDPSSLRLKRVGERDGGVYQCRVHYQASPAVDFVIELRLVDSPGTPRIINSDGFDLSGNVGQLRLGSNMTLICEVDNADGTLVWWERNGVEMARAQSIQDGVLRTTVGVVNATRDELNAHYVCLAQNADVTDPLLSSLVVKMYLPPMSVEIRLNNNLDFEAGQPRVVDCVVVGCVPPPTITWHLGDVMLRPNVHKELHDGNYTVSSLTLAPSLRDDKHELRCRAHNSHLPREIFEDVVALNVGFRPICINEGKEEVVGYVAGQVEDVVCTVEAYPGPVQFSWTFADSKTLYTNAKKLPGYEHRYSSSLAWKPNDQDRGELLCRATNVLGEQKHACVYAVVAGGPPLVPDCELLYKDLKAEINCKKGWDGGRPQTFHLELQHDGTILQNVSDSYGHFALPMPQKSNITALVYATNNRGRSEPTILTLTSLSDSTSNVLRAPQEAIMMQVFAGSVAFGAMLAMVARCIYNLRRKTDETIAEPEEPHSPIRSDGSFHRQQEFQPVPQEECPFTPPLMTISPCDNYYSVTPTRTVQLLGQTVSSPARGRNGFSEIEHERTSYFV